MQRLHFLGVILGLALGEPLIGCSALGAPPSIPSLIPPNAPSTYSAEAIEAWVVDEDTGQPLEGVIVVANWELQALMEGRPVGQMMVMETVTDATGRFYFSSWGPKPRWPLEGELVDADPRLLLFKNGYKAKGLQNKVKSQYNTGPIRRSDWNEKTIKLKKAEESDKMYIASLETVDDRLEFAFFHHDCSWKKIPRMLITLDQEHKRLEQKGIYNSIRPIEYRDQGPDVAKCGTMREFLRSYPP